MLSGSSGFSLPRILAHFACSHSIVLSMAIIRKNSAPTINITPTTEKMKAKGENQRKWDFMSFLPTESCWRAILVIAGKGNDFELRFGPPRESNAPWSSPSQVPSAVQSITSSPISPMRNTQLNGE